MLRRRLISLGSFRRQDVRLRPRAGHVVRLEDNLVVGALRQVAQKVLVLFGFNGQRIGVVASSLAVMMSTRRIALDVHRFERVGGAGAVLGLSVAHVVALQLAVPGLAGRGSPGNSNRGGAQRFDGDVQGKASRLLLSGVQRNRL